MAMNQQDLPVQPEPQDGNVAAPPVEPFAESTPQPAGFEQVLTALQGIQDVLQDNSDRLSLLESSNYPTPSYPQSAGQGNTAAQPQGDILSQLGIKPTAPAPTKDSEADKRMDAFEAKWALREAITSSQIQPRDEVGRRAIKAFFNELLEDPQAANLPVEQVAQLAVNWYSQVSGRQMVPPPTAAGSPQAPTMQPTQPPTGVAPAAMTPPRNIAELANRLSQTPNLRFTEELR